jgi:hypothetical protein
MVGAEAAFDPVLQVPVQGCAGPTGVGFRAVCPGQVNNSKGIGRVGCGEEYVITPDVPGNGPDRDIKQDVPAAKFLAEFDDVDLAGILQGFPGLDQSIVCGICRNMVVIQFLRSSASPATAMNASPVRTMIGS